MKKLVNIISMILVINIVLMFSFGVTRSSSFDSSYNPAIVKNSKLKIGKRNIIFVGDSYTCGGSKIGISYYSFASRLKDMLPCTTTVLGSSGAGFVMPGENGKNFQMILDEFSEDRTKVTDIYVLGGFNDRCFSSDAIHSNMMSFSEYCKVNFPNADLYCGMISGSTYYNDINLLQNVTEAYKGCINFGFTYVTDSEHILDKTAGLFLCSDAIHPNTPGHAHLANHLYNYIMNGAIDTNASSIASFHIDNQVFDDNVFINWILNNADTNHNGYLELDEASSVTSINIDDKGLHSVKGIEIFKNLIAINLNNCSLTQLNVTGNPKIEVITCDNNELQNLLFNDNLYVTYLSCSNNQLKELDLTKCLYLNTLKANGNYISYLNVSNSENLSTLLNLGYKRVTKAYAVTNWNYSYNYIANWSDDFIVAENNGSCMAFDVYTTIINQSSIDSISSFIDRLYNVALDRDAEEAGKDYWISKVRYEDYSGSDVARGFLFSDEFLNKPMSYGEFLTILYRTFFDREPDEIGMNYWVNEFVSGKSKNEIIDGFCDSNEWAVICASYGILVDTSSISSVTLEPNDEIKAFVSRLYDTCLNRTPDEVGYNYWIYRLANMQESGTSIATGFFFSDEFISRNYDDITYLSLLYRTILNREADEAGLYFWLNNISAGYTRMEILLGFVSSTEWINNCSRFGIIA